MRVILPFVVLMLLAGCQTSLVAHHGHPAGTYGNLEYHEESGDLLGVEIQLLPTVQGWQAVVIISEGEPAVPVVVSVRIESGEVSFRLPESMGGVTFAGKFVDGDLRARLGLRELVLRRGPSYWP